MAHFKAVETAGDNENRCQWKVSLIKKLYRSGYEKQDVIWLFNFIDWVKALPEELEEKLWTEIQKIKEEKKVVYISSSVSIVNKGEIEEGVS